MIGAPQMNWRQIMQQAQPMPQNTGSMFPVRGPQGGWQMPRMQPQAPAPQAPAPMAAAHQAQSPLSFMGSAPMMGPGMFNPAAMMGSLWSGF